MVRPQVMSRVLLVESTMKGKGERSWGDPETQVYAPVYKGK
jgi:hypothetical protein